MLWQLYLRALAAELRDAGVLAADADVASFERWVNRYDIRSRAQDLYTVSGSPVRAVSERPDQAEHRATHERILEMLMTPGRVESGNEMPVDLLED